MLILIYKFLYYISVYRICGFGEQGYDMLPQQFDSDIVYDAGIQERSLPLAF